MDIYYFDSTSISTKEIIQGFEVGKPCGFLSSQPYPKIPGQSHWQQWEQAALIHPNQGSERLSGFTKVTWLAYGRAKILIQRHALSVTLQCCSKCLFQWINGWTNEWVSEGRSYAVRHIVASRASWRCSGVWKNTERLFTHPYIPGLGRNTITVLQARIQSHQMSSHLIKNILSYLLLLTQTDARAQPRPATHLICLLSFIHFGWSTVIFYI